MKSQLYSLMRTSGSPPSCSVSRARLASKASLSLWVPRGRVGPTICGWPCTPANEVNRVKIFHCPSLCVRRATEYPGPITEVNWRWTVMNVKSGNGASTLGAVGASANPVALADAKVACN